MKADGRNQRGFALLEVLVAFAIAAAALAVLAQAGGTGLTSVKASGSYEEAVSRARSHLAAIGRDVSLGEGSYEGDDGGGFRWHIHVAPLATAVPPPLPAGQPAAAPAGEPPSLPAVLYSVDVTISWRDGGGGREVTLRTARVTARRAS